MSAIRIISRNIDVKPFLKEFRTQEDNWQKAHAKMESKEYPVGLYGREPNTIIPFKCGTGVSLNDASSKADTQKTEFFEMYPKLMAWVHSFNKPVGRVLCFKLKPNSCSVPHPDSGEYYTYFDRYQLCLQGTYEYTVGKETEIITPGTFFWFNNLITHQAKNISDVDRLAVVIDLQRGLNALSIESDKGAS